MPSRVGHITDSREEFVHSRRWRKGVPTPVIVVGAGPTGLMLAGELRLAGARPLVLERRPRLRETPKANGFSGQILDCCATGACWTGSKRPAPAAATRHPGSRSAVYTWTSHTWRTRRCGCWGSRNRDWNACSTNAPANSAPTSAAGTRCSG